MELREVKMQTGWRVELCDGDRSISRCSVVERTVRIGAARLAVGGIGGVGTLPEYRRKGYSRRVMEAAVQLMIREAYDISLLHGIQDFYHKYDFITCMAEHEFWLDTRDAERAGKGARIRPLKPEDIPAVVEMYNRDNAARIGSAVREVRTWRGFKMGTWWTIPAQVRLVVSPHDEVIGYVVYDDVADCCRAAEVGGRGGEIFAAILHFLARRAVKLRREKVWANVPEDHPFAIYCREFGLRLNTFYSRNEKWMGRIIAFESCMEKLLPELERRWGMEDRKVALGLHTDGGAGTLCWQQDKLVFSPSLGVAAVQVNQQRLMQLLLGYVRPEDLVAMGLLQMPAGKGRLMSRLFPLQQAYMWWADRF